MQTLHVPPVLNIQPHRWFSRTRDVVLRLLADSWRRLTDTAQLDWPVVSIAIVIGLCIALAQGLAHIDVYSVEDMLASRNSDTRSDASGVRQMFPSSPRFTHLLFTALDAEGNGNDDNVLTTAIFDDIWSIARQVASLEVGRANDDYQTVCYRYSGKANCAPYGVLSIWDGNESLYRATVEDDESLRIELSTDTYLDGTPIPRDLVFGDYTTSIDGASGEEVLEHARGVVVTYALSENSDNSAAIIEWEQAFLRLAAGAELSACRVVWQAETWSAADGGKWMEESKCFGVVVSLVIMAVASSLLLGDILRFCEASTHSRIALGFVGVLLLMLSTAAAGGALAMGRVPVAGIHVAFIPVVCVALGLQNMFDLCSKLDDTLYDMPARDRMSEAASRWASGSVFVGQVSFITLVAGAGPVSSPPMRWFCAYAGTGVVIGWLVQVFALVPCLMLDEKRRDSGRFDVVCCFVQPADADTMIGESPPIGSRRDSFVVDPLADGGLTLPSNSFKVRNDQDQENACIEPWGDTGDDRRSSLVLSLSPSIESAWRGGAGRLPMPSPYRSPLANDRFNRNTDMLVSPVAGMPRPPTASRDAMCFSRYAPCQALDLYMCENNCVRGTGGCWGSDRPISQAQGSEAQRSEDDHCVNQQQEVRRQLHNPGGFNVGATSCFDHCLVDGRKPFLHDRTLGRFGTGAGQRQSPRVLRNARLPLREESNPDAPNGQQGGKVTPVAGISTVSGCSERCRVEGNGGSGICPAGNTVVQGYCNWLLHEHGAKWALLAIFGLSLVGGAAVCLTQLQALQGDGKYAFYPRSSYLQQYIATARELRVLFGETSLPVAAYVQGVDLSVAANQQAILNLETVLTSSSPFTTTSTVSVLGASTENTTSSFSWYSQTPSSWLRGFIAWLPSSSYASSSALDGLEAGLWGGTAALFDIALKEFLAEPGSQRFKGDLSFIDGRATACRIWARHIDFRGTNAVMTMKAAKDAVAMVRLDPPPFVFAREYIYAEHYALEAWDLVCCMMVTLVLTVGMGYLFLGRLAPVCILVLATSAVQVETLAMILLVDGDDSGLNTYAITPSLLLAAAFCATSTGALLRSFTSQDPERSFHVNLRISIAETAGPLCSTSFVVVAGVLPLLLYFAVTCTDFVRVFWGSMLWSMSLSVAHGLLLAPTLLLVCGEILAMGERCSPFLSVVEADTLPWLPRGSLGNNIELLGKGYALAVGSAGAAALLSDEEDCSVGGNKINERENSNGGEGRKHDILPEKYSGKSRLHPYSNYRSCPDPISATNLSWVALGARAAMDAAAGRSEATGTVVGAGGAGGLMDYRNEERQMIGIVRETTVGSGRMPSQVRGGSWGGS